MVTVAIHSCTLIDCLKWWQILHPDTFAKLTVGFSTKYWLSIVEYTNNKSVECSNVKVDKAAAEAALGCLGPGNITCILLCLDPCI